MFDELLRDFVRFMDGQPSLPLLVVIIACIQPLVALLHEVGHAIAATALLPGRVLVAVGGGRPLVTFSLGRITIRFHPLVLPWRFDAVCDDDTHQSRAEAVVIALAGPAASVATGIVAWVALRTTSGAPVLDDVLAVATLGLFATAIVCLIPLTLTDTCGETMRTDGACVLAAMR